MLTTVLGSRAGYRACFVAAIGWLGLSSAAPLLDQGAPPDAVTLEAMLTRFGFRGAALLMCAGLVIRASRAVWNAVVPYGRRVGDAVIALLEGQRATNLRNTKALEDLARGLGEALQRGCEHPECFRVGMAPSRTPATPGPGGPF